MRQFKQLHRALLLIRELLFDPEQDKIILKIFAMKSYITSLFLGAAAASVSIANADDLNWLVMADWGGQPSNPYTTPQEWVHFFFGCPVSPSLEKTHTYCHIPNTQLVTPWYRCYALFALTITPVGGPRRHLRMRFSSLLSVWNPFTLRCICMDSSFCSGWALPKAWES